MTLVYEYINVLIQFGSMDCDLVISDSEDENFEPIRISKSFDENVTQQELQDAAEAGIQRILTEIQEAPYVEANEFLKQEIGPIVNQFLNSISVIPNNLNPTDFKAQVAIYYDLMLALMSGTLE